MKIYFQKEDQTMFNIPFILWYGYLYVFRTSLDILKQRLCLVQFIRQQKHFFLIFVFEIIVSCSAIRTLHVLSKMGKCCCFPSFICVYSSTETRALLGFSMCILSTAGLFLAVQCDRSCGRRERSCNKPLPMSQVAAKLQIKV